MHGESGFRYFFSCQEQRDKDNRATVLERTPWLIIHDDYASRLACTARLQTGLHVPTRLSGDDAALL
jgi:hypothetical protein